MEAKSDTIFDKQATRCVVLTCVKTVSAGNIIMQTSGRVLRYEQNTTLKILGEKLNQNDIACVCRVEVMNGGFIHGNE